MINFFDDSGEQFALGAWRFLFPKRYRSKAAKIFAVSTIIFLAILSAALVTAFFVFP